MPALDDALAQQQAALRRYSRRGWLAITAAFAALIIGGVLLFNYLAACEWEETKAELTAAGETLDFHKLLPPPVPDADNYCAIPELKDIALIVDGDREAGEPGRKRAALASLYANEGPRSLGKVKRVSNGIELADPIDIKEWIKSFEGSTLVMPSATQNHAADLLQAIDSAYPDLKPLLQACGRKQSQFTPGPSERVWPLLLVASPLLHVVPNYAMSHILNLRVTAAALAGNDQAAFESLLTHLKLCKAADQEPMLVGQLLAISTRSWAYESLWQCLHQRVFTESQLNHLQKQLAEYNPSDHYLYALRTELAAMVQADEYLKTHRIELRNLNLLDPGQFTFMELAPNGFFDHNTSLAAKLQLEHLIKPLKTTGFIGALDGAFKLKSENERLQKHWSSPLNALVLESLDTYSGVIRNNLHLSLPPRSIDHRHRVGALLFAASALPRDDAKSGARVPNRSARRSL